MDNIDKELLQKVAGLHSIPQGAYNIRKNGQILARNCVDGIEITSKTDKTGIDVSVASHIQNQSIHIPVIVTESDMHDDVYNDFHIAPNAEITIVGGCGLHTTNDKGNSHSGIHEFWLGENSCVRYVENHYAQGNVKAEKVLNPVTKLHLGKGAKFIMETAQLGGVSSSIRNTYADLEDNAVLEVKESILTECDQTAVTNFTVDLNGNNSHTSVVSRAVAKNNSTQEFNSMISGNNLCFGHVECDAIIFDNAQVKSLPALKNTHVDANLSHEAAIGKIAGDQLIKLQSLGLTKEEAEQAILRGFLNS